MPPAPPDSPVGRASGPVGGARRIRSSPASQTGARTTRLPTRGALETLLVDLGSQIQSGSSLLARATGTGAAGRRASAANALEILSGHSRRDAAGHSTRDAAGHSPENASEQDAATTRRVHATGFAGLDARLGGGFPADRLSEICGADRSGQVSPHSSGHSSGRTSLALGMLAETLSRGVLVAWVDLADAFDPLSAAEAIRARGGDEADLDRLLWVRARTEDEALRSCDRLLKTEGFELVFLDLFVSNGARAPQIKDVTWLRLARLAAGTRTALVVLSNEPLTGSRAELILEMRARTARFVGPPSLLEGFETDAHLLRHRSRPIGQEVTLFIGSQEGIATDEIDPEISPPEPDRTKMRRAENRRPRSARDRKR